MTPALNLQTIEAHPLGKPSDRLRYGMTPAMAQMYADILSRVGNEPSLDFNPDLRGMAVRLGLAPKGIGRLQTQLAELQKRGWVKKVWGTKKYRLVPPVMHFPRVPAQWEVK